MRISIRLARLLFTGVAVAALAACGGGSDSTTTTDTSGSGGGGGGGGGTAGTLTVSSASTASRNGNYTPVGAVFAGASSTAYNGQTADGKFEIEVVWGSDSSIKRAHLWYFDSATVIKFFGCDGGKSVACTGVSYDPAAKEVRFSNVTWNEVTPSLDGSAPDTAVAGAEHLTVNGILSAK